MLMGLSRTSFAYHPVIRPGKPVENAYSESFHGRFGDECLNENWFLLLEQARRIIEAWRVDYNTRRPHRSLRYLTPEEFIDQKCTKFFTGMPVKAGLLNAGYSNGQGYYKRGKVTIMVIYLQKDL